MKFNKVFKKIDDSEIYYSIEPKGEYNYKGETIYLHNYSMLLTEAKVNHFSKLEIDRLETVKCTLYPKGMYDEQTCIKDVILTTRNIRVKRITERTITEIYE